MANFIASGATTVGEVVDGAAELLLSRMYARKVPGKGVSQKEIDKIDYARRAIEVFQKHLNEVFCDDRDTRLRDVKVPQR